MGAGLREEGRIAELADREIDEAEHQPEEDEAAEGAENGLRGDATMVDDPEQGDRQRRGDEQGDREQVDEAEDRRRVDEEEDAGETDAGDDRQRLRAVDRVAVLRV